MLTILSLDNGKKDVFVFKAVISKEAFASRGLPILLDIKTAVGEITLL